MASTEITKILTIDTTSLKEYKKHIDDLRGALLGLEKGSEDYKKVEDEIIKETTKLNEVLKTGKKNVEYVKGSYYDLNKQLVEAKKQWKSLSEEQRNSPMGKELQQHIVDLDKQLKGLDSNIGQYQRNVGNYGSAFSMAFKSAGDSLKGAIPAVGKFNSALKMLMTNPVGAVIGAIALAVTAVVKAMKGSESQMNRFKVATSSIRMVVDQLKNAISAVADTVVKVVEKIDKVVIKVLTKARNLTEKLGWKKITEGIDSVLVKMDEYHEMAEREIAVTQKRRTTEIELAKAENYVAELRAKLAEKNKYSDEERLKLIEKWEAAEKHKAALQVALAKEEYELIVQQNKNTENSTQDMEAETSALANLIRAQGSYNESLREINRMKAQLLKNEEEVTEEVKEQNEAVSDGAEEAERLLKEYNRLYEERMAVLEKQNESQLFYADLEIDNEVEKANRIYEINRQLLEDKIALQEEYIENFLGGVDDQLKAEQELVDMKEQLRRLDLTNEKRVNQQAVEDARVAQQNKINYAINYANAIGDVFSAISELSEEGSREQKSLAIMAATINTLASVVGVIYSVWTDPTIPSAIAKGALSVTLSAGVLASGLAQINKIKNTNKGNSGSLSQSGIETPQLENVGVTPLLNEEQDIQNLQSLTVSGDSDRDMRVYVVESDITQAQNNTKTKVNNSTF